MNHSKIICSLLIIMVACRLTASCQVAFMNHDLDFDAKYSTGNWNKLKGRTLLVVIDDNNSPDYSKVMRDGFTKYWNLNKVLFINASQVNNYIDSDKYAIFSFTVIDTKRSPTVVSQMGPGGNLQPVNSSEEDINKVIAADELATFSNNKSKSIREEATDHYCFEFFLCGTIPALKKHKLDNLTVCDYAPIAVENEDNIKLRHDVYAHPVKYFQSMMIPYVIPEIIRFKWEMSSIAPGANNYPAIGGSPQQTQVSFSIIMNGKDHPKHPFTADCTYLSGGPAFAKTRKIYVDSTRANDKVVHLFSNLLKVDLSDFVLTSREQINEAFTKNDSTILILDYNYYDIYGTPTPFYYGLYTTQGQLVATTLLNGVAGALKTIPGYDLHYLN